MPATRIQITDTGRIVKKVDWRKQVFRCKSTLSKAMRLLAAFVILFATLWYLAGIAKGCARLLKSVLDTPYVWGAFLIIFVTCAYTIWGGM